MRIGIATFHWSQNYGALLQTYALKKIIEEYGHEVFIIDKRPTLMSKKESLISRVKDSILAVSHPLDGWRINEQKTLLEEFREKYFSLRKEEDVGRLDVIVCGSDQIWNSKLTGGKLEPLYFGESKYIACDYRISYAASLGECEIPKSDIEEFTRLVNNINVISVREESLINEVNKYTDKKVENVLDPTLLLKKSDYEELISSRIEKKQRYVLIYQNTYDERLYKIAKAVAKQKGLKVIEIARKRYRPLQRCETILNGGVETFLAMYKDADYVVTNTFHGTVFAIQFEKEFVSIPLKGRESRVLNLLQKVKLENRIIRDSNVEFILNLSNIDYSHVKEELYIQKKKSCSYLFKAIGDRKND